MTRLNELLMELRSVLEAPQPSSDSQRADSAEAQLQNPDEQTPPSCPKGFKFDGQHCVPIEPKKKKADANKKYDPKAPNEPVEEPPAANPEGAEADMPKTRFTPQSKEIPYVPDPEHEIMKYPYNAVTYANGKRTFEYAADEYGEYGKNSFTMAKFPDAFADKNEFIKEYLNGEHTVVEDWTPYQHTDAAEQKEGDLEGLHNRIWKYASKEAEAQKANAQESFKAQLEDLIKKAAEEQPETTPPIIIGKHVDQGTGKETRYLLSGNTRAMIYAFLGKPAPVRIVPLKGRMLQDPSEEELKSVLWPAEQSSENPEEAEQNIRNALQIVFQQRAGQAQQAQSGAMESLKTVFDTVVKQSNESVTDPIGPYRIHTVKRWGKFFYQKRANGEWDKLGVPPKKEKKK